MLFENSSVSGIARVLHQVMRDLAEEDRRALLPRAATRVALENERALARRDQQGGVLDGMSAFLVLECLAMQFIQQVQRGAGTQIVRVQGGELCLDLRDGGCCEERQFRLRGGGACRSRSDSR